MKKNVFYLFLISISLISFISCSDDDTHATAKIDFIGYLKSIDFSDHIIDEEDSSDEELSDKTDSNDTELDDDSDKPKTEDGYDYTDAITKAFAEMKFIGEKSVITESASVNINDISYAQLICFQQVEPKLKARFDNVQLSDVLAALYANDYANLNKLGYYNPEQIPLKNIKATIVYTAYTLLDYKFTFDLNLK